MILAEAIRKAHRVYLIGNGGSAANATHIANDLVLSCGIRAHALTADTSILTAAANDQGYHECFTSQIRVYGERGDLLIALSGSGRSPNVLKALSLAKKLGMSTLALFGNFGDVEDECAEIIIREGHDMQAAEEAQLALGHEAMRALKG